MMTISYSYIVDQINLETNRPLIHRNDLLSNATFDSSIDVKNENWQAKL